MTLSKFNKMVVMNSKAQSWSIDIGIAVFVFIVAFLSVYGLLNADKNTQTSELKEEASIVIKQVSSEDTNLRIIDGNQINESKLNELKNVNYDELKRKLRVAGDFCIYFEDDEGNLVIIGNSYTGIGSSVIYLSGTPCSQG